MYVPTIGVMTCVRKYHNMIIIIGIPIPIGKHFFFHLILRAFKHNLTEISYWRVMFECVCINYYNNYYFYADMTCVSQVTISYTSIPRCYSKYATSYCRFTRVIIFYGMPRRE